MSNLQTKNTNEKPGSDFCFCRQYFVSTRNDNDFNIVCNDISNIPLQGNMSTSEQNSIDNCYQYHSKNLCTTKIFNNLDYKKIKKIFFD